MLKMVLIAVVASIGASIMFLASGFLMPREHRAQASQVFNAPQAKVWAFVADMRGAPVWQHGVSRVQQLPDMDGHERWRVFDSSGRVETYVTLLSEAPHRIVREVATGKGAPFGGTWTITLTAQGESTRVTVVEDGWIAVPVLRPVQRFVFGFNSGINAYLASLARAVGSQQK